MPLHLSFVFGADPEPGAGIIASVTSPRFTESGDFISVRKQLADLPKLSVGQLP